MGILFVFIDGIGIGLNVPHNPCASPGMKIFNNFLNESRYTPLPQRGDVIRIDANLDIAGIPQSATGQTTIFTGCNAAAYLGYHRSGFPNEKLRDLIAHEALFIKLKQASLKPVFINAYRSIFFELGPEKLLPYLSVTSIQNWKAGCKFYSIQDVIYGKSIYHDFTNQELIVKGIDVPVVSPEKAAAIASAFLNSHDFVLYEYFKTDKTGHSRNYAEAVQLIHQLETFLLSLLNMVDLSKHTIIVTSDHGNIEDLSVKTHTRNPVPFMVWGLHKGSLCSSMESIVEIRDRILEYDYINV